MIQSLKNIISPYQSELNIHLFCDPGISLLAMRHHPQINAYALQKAYTRMSNSMFIHNNKIMEIIQRYTNRMDKLHMHTMEYYIEIKCIFDTHTNRRIL